MDKTIINHVIDGISGIFQPIINLLSAAGLLKGTLAILTAADVLSASSETYLVLNAMADSLHTASIIREYRGMLPLIHRCIVILERIFFSAAM